MSQTAPSAITSSLIRAIGEEIKAVERSRREYRVTHGKRVSGTAARKLYTFKTKANLRAKDDTQCSLTFSGVSHQGTIASSSDGLITIALTQDVGSAIPTADLCVDETQLLKELRTALYALGQDNEEEEQGKRKAPWNKGLALRTLGQQQPRRVDRLSLPELPNDLTDDQRHAIETVFAQETTFLWGPPGTGKTHTLGAMAHALYSAGQRILIVSHTNRAVDGLVEALCNRLTDKGANPMPVDTVVRLGPIARESLRERYGTAVAFDDIIRRIDEEAESVESLLYQEQLVCKKEIESLSKLPPLWEDRKRVLAKIRELQQRFCRHTTGVRGLVRRVFGESTSLAQLLHDIRVEVTEQEALVTELNTQLEGIEEGVWESRTADLNERIRALQSEIDKAFERALHAKESLIDDAQVVAMSTTQAFLRASSLLDFDVILIDEASMVPLPVAYYLSGMVSSRVVIGGDFRQLPPIAHSKDEIVREWYAKDIFFAAGVVDDVNAGKVRPNLAKLTSQFRSHADLCELINGRFYGGDLTSSFTDKTGLTYTPELEYLRDNRIILIDTSEYAGSGQFVSKSKSNLIHAMVIRTLCDQLRPLWQAEKAVSLGVISPYRPQAELIKDLLVEGGRSDVAVGTVHRFQGDERAIMVLDLTESEPHSLGGFFTASSLSEEGARLWNVAFSRAQRNLVVVANLSYFKRKLAPRHVMRGIIKDLEARALLLKADKLMTSVPHMPEVTVGNVVSFASPPPQYFSEVEFSAAFTADIKEARYEIFIVSAFISVTRVRAVRDLLVKQARSGVAITVVIPPLSENGSIDAKSYDMAVGMLKEMGATVITKRALHAKIVCVDREVVWTGSLNPLSFSGRNTETMVRHVSSAAYVSVTQQFASDGASKKSSTSLFANSTLK